MWEGCQWLGVRRFPPPVTTGESQLSCNMVERVTKMEIQIPTGWCGGNVRLQWDASEAVRKCKPFLSNKPCWRSLHTCMCPFRAEHWLCSDNTIKLLWKGAFMYVIIYFLICLFMYLLIYFSFICLVEQNQRQKLKWKGKRNSMMIRHTILCKEWYPY